MKKLFFCFSLLTINTFFVFSQNAVALDQGLNEATKYFSGRLPKNSKIVVLFFTAKTPQLSDYLVEELTAHMVNSGTFTVVDRKNLELIQQEMEFQLSGEVSESSAQEIGQKLGAETVITGTFELLGNIYRMRVKGLSVETAQVQGVWTGNVGNDQILAALTTQSQNATAESLTYVAAYAAAVASANAKPLKKEPLRRRNFEVIQGRSRNIRPPIDMDLFHASAISSLKRLKYEIVEENPGVITYRRSSRSWWVVIKLCYWTDEYWFEYVDSQNLKADPLRNQIHRNYYAWIERLNEELAELYAVNRRRK